MTTGLPGYAYLVEATIGRERWQKVGVAADRRRVRQHRGWTPLIASVQVPGYRLADPKTDVESPLLESVRGSDERTPTISDPRCPDCGTAMPDLPAHGHTEAWHVRCRGSRLDLFTERLTWAREHHPYPDWTTAHFPDGVLDAHSLVSSNGRLVHAGEYPQLPLRAQGSDTAEHTAHLATSFYVKTVPADEVLGALTEAAMHEEHLSRFIRDHFGPNACRHNGQPMVKPSGSGGIPTTAKVQERLDAMALLPDLTVAFVNDRAAGILHAFAEADRS